MSVVPDVMAAAVLQGKGRLAIEDVPVPVVGPDDVLVEVSHCGVCGSDLHMMLDGWGEPGGVGGHEWSGRVAALGPDVAGWEVGSPVVGGDLVTCGECVYCTSGRPSLCVARGAVVDDIRIDPAKLCGMTEFAFVVSWHRA